MSNKKSTATATTQTASVLGEYTPPPAKVYEPEQTPHGVWTYVPPSAAHISKCIEATRFWTPYWEGLHKNAVRRLKRLLKQAKPDERKLAKAKFEVNARQTDLERHRKAISDLLSKLGASY